MNHLRNIMGQERLSSLSILSIESKILHAIDLNEAVDHFVNQKVRKKNNSRKNCQHNSMLLKNDSFVLIGALSALYCLMYNMYKFQPASHA